MAQQAKSRRQSVPLVVVALPFSYREGMDEYNGVMRYLRETGKSWDLRIIRHSFGADVFADFPIDEVSGVICGMNFRQGIVSYEPNFPEDVIGLLADHDIPVVGLDIPRSSHLRRGGKARFRHPPFAFHLPPFTCQPGESLAINQLIPENSLAKTARLFSVYC